MVLASGRLNDTDLALYRNLARFNTLQQPFFQSNGSLAPGYESIAIYPEQLQRSSEVTVQIAQELPHEIDNKYPELKPPAPSETQAE